MKIGEQHKINLNGYVFHDTLSGPMVFDSCVDCGQSVLVVGVTDRVNVDGLKEDTGGEVQPRCSTCGRRHHGAGLEYYGTGRTDVIKVVESPELDRLRRLANQRYEAEQRG